MTQEEIDISLPDAASSRRKRIRKLAFFVFLLVVIIHFVVGITAGFIVVARYFSKPAAQFVATPQINVPPEEREHRVKMEQLDQIRPKKSYTNRIQSLKPTALTLPDLPKVAVDTIVPIEQAVPSAEPGVGSGLGGKGNGTGTGGFFGGTASNGSALLEGTLYDLKQTANGSALDMTRQKYVGEIAQMTHGGSGEAALRRYFAAPTKLYLPYLAIPRMDAKRAPTEFKVGNIVKPKFWVAVYTGRFIAPETGKFQFVGFADDILLVRVDRRLVFDGSLLGKSYVTGGRVVYDGSDSYTAHIKGPGAPFSVKQGEIHDIEVIIGECPGGHFSAWLQIQKVGEGQPYWFRMTSNPVKFSGKGDSYKDSLHVVNRNGPVWQAAPAKEKLPAVLP